jgi:hypothetical protein
VSNVARSLPLARISINSVLISFIIEVINVLVTSLAGPVLYIYGIGTLPYGIAQLIVFIIWTLTIIIPVTGIAIACFELHYVTNFSTSFAFSPERVGKLTITAITIVCCVPSLLLITESTLRGGISSQAAAFLVGEQYQNNDPSAIMLIYATITFVCIILMIIMLSISFICIPFYLRKLRSTPSENGNLPPSDLRFSVKRLFLIGFAFGANVSLIITVKNKSQDIKKVPVQAFVGTFTLNFVLLLLEMLDKEAVAFTRRHLFNFQSMLFPIWQILRKVFGKKTVSPGQNNALENYNNNHETSTTTIINIISDNHI